MNKNRMPPKRKTQATRIPSTYLPTDNASTDLQKNSTIAKRQPLISAIAARRALALVSVTKDSEDEEDNEIIQANVNGDDVDYTVEDEDEEDEEGTDDYTDHEGQVNVRISRGDQRRANEKNVFLDPTSISQFIPTLYNVKRLTVDVAEDIVLLHLKPKESICFQGSVLLSPIYGSVTVFGATLKGASFPVTKPFDLISIPETILSYSIFSPRTHALAVIEPAERPPHLVLPGHTNFKPSPLLRKYIHEAIIDFGNFTENSAVILIQTLQWCGIEGIGTMAPLFRNIFKIDEQSNIVVEPPAKIRKMDNLDVTMGENEVDDESRWNLIKLPGFHPIFRPTSGVKAFGIPETWLNAASNLNGQLSESKVILICGGKKMGKSTFARYLVNSMLGTYSKVAFLEADVGQSEFTPQGIVSLNILISPILGPPFTHPIQRAHRAFFVGATTPKDDPDYYISCIRELINCWREYCSESADSIPLIINTHGWIKGLGYDLLINILQLALPTHVFTFYSPFNPTRNLPSHFASLIPESSKAPPPLSQQFPMMEDIIISSKYQPSDHRTMTLLSYFYANTIAFGKYGEKWWDFECRLVERIPWCLDWVTGVKGIWVLFEEVKWSQVLFALNGSIVGLLGDIEDVGDVREEPLTEKQQQSAMNGKVSPPQYFSAIKYPPPPPTHTTCYGLALIRSIDPSTHTFHILTSLSSDELFRCNVIVKGSIEIPIWAMLDNRNGGGAGICGVPWKKVPYLSFQAGDGAGSGARRARKNLMRRGQMRA